MLNTNKVCALLGTRYPVIQGGMARVATGEFAAHVSNSGGLGTIGSGSMEPWMLREHIEHCQALTDKPFAVNLMMMNPYCAEMVDIIIEYKVPIVTTGAGSPAPYLEKLHAAGIKVIPVVASATMAIRMERLGVDAIIAEGCEAGGHIGELTTMVLTTEVAKAVSLPVLAAGGIATPEQVAAAFALGASGIQCGTVLLSAKECPIHANFKKHILGAKSTDSMVIGRINGLATRVLKNKMARNFIKEEKSGKSLEEFELLTLGGLRKAVVDGDTQEGSLMAGQVVGLVQEERTLKEIMAYLFEDLDKIFKKAEGSWGHADTESRE